jgi:hypothetical protein
VARLVEAAVTRDPRPLTVHRDLANYLYGTCHDFALLAAGALRERGVPARLRVGCAGYFVTGRWEDHWICEYEGGAIRAGEGDPATCGVRFAGIDGAWFVAAAVLRDAAALAGIECLPWDYWGPARRFLETREVGADAARDIDALAAALDPAPASRDAAEAILARFPWARPTDTVLSVIVTTPVEAPIRPPEIR